MVVQALHNLHSLLNLALLVLVAATTILDVRVAFQVSLRTVVAVSQVNKALVMMR
jgi:hypothetical protein